ncbi:hypothetical protein IAQ67_28575 (plasmid) [Paenibacillus peoriae]|uniref:Uncharacterized protein n=1 Tax=Paenibacillus peoriae TaxID=59893 RepID=A0A7H0YHB0_9BACL|nr:hypothetical protein [Paenibacillus peoriae]QNR70468.1 hypothetical protein IAQ67_28575 [Paenibacillus peoriae]
MDKQKAVIWGYTGTRWTKRKHVLIDGLASTDLDTLNAYDNIHGGHHSFFPPGVNPNKHAVINQMRATAEKNVKHYINDFYHIDTYLYFKYDQTVIWMTRECGTNIYPAQSIESEQHRESVTTSFNYYTNQGRDSNKLYKVDNTQVVPVKTDKARQIIGIARSGGNRISDQERRNSAIQHTIKGV